MLKKIAQVLPNVLLLLTFPLLSHAQSFVWINNVIAGLTSMVMNLVPLAIGVALLVFIWGLVVFITQSDNEQARAEGRQKMIWGIIALFVIVCAWGLVNLIRIIAGVSSGNPASIVAPNIL